MSCERFQETVFDTAKDSSKAVRKNRSKKGTATVEAAVILPIVVLIFVSILSIIRITATYEHVQCALNQVAEELSQYSYFYALSGLNEQHDQAIDNISEAKEEMKNRQNAVSSFYESLQELSEDVSQVAQGNENTVDVLFDTIHDLQDTNHSYEELVQYVEEILNDPMGEVQVIGLALSDTLLSKTKTALFSVITKSMVKGRLSKELSTSSKELGEKLRICGGMDGLDFSGSTFFDDKETIDLIVEYTVKPMPDFLLIPEIRLRNRACVYAWTWGVDGEIESIGEETESLWNIDKNKDPRSQHMKRGLIIEKRFAAELIESPGANGLITPMYFPTVDAIEYASDGNQGTVYAMVSLNPFLKSYQTRSGITGNIKKHIHKLVCFEKGETKGCSIDITKNRGSYKKVLYVIVPENSELPEAFFAAFEELKDDIERDGIQLEYVKRYGDYSNVEENESENK